MAQTVNKIYTRILFERNNMTKLQKIIKVVEDLRHKHIGGEDCEWCALYRVTKDFPCSCEYNDAIDDALKAIIKSIEEMEEL